MAETAPIYVRPSAVQAMFGIHRGTLYRWAAAGLVTIHKRGAMSFVRVADLERIIETGGGPAGGPDRQKAKL